MDVRTTEPVIDLTVRAHARPPDIAGHPAPAAEPPAITRAPVANDRSYRLRFLVADLAALAVLLLVGGFENTPPRLMLVMPLGVLCAFRFLNLYAPVTRPFALDQSSRIGLAAAGVSLVAGALARASAGQACMVGALATVLLISARAGAYGFERRWASHHPRRVLLVGSGAAAQEFAGRLQRHSDYGMQPLGFVDDSPQPIDPDLGLPVLGGASALPRLTRELGIDRVIVDTSAVPEEEIRSVLDRAAAEGAEVAVLPSLAQHLSTAISVESLAGMTILVYQRSRLGGPFWMAKRVIDIVVALALGIVTLPLSLAVMIAIRLDSPGPVLFRQERVGRGGVPFVLFKFRSMTVDAETRRTEVLDLNEADGPCFKATCDPRITRVGRVIRRWSLDELPQLLNVVRGEMSLVGPRPALPGEVAQYSDWFFHRLEVAPGLTGLWQVSGRFLVPFHEAARLDVFYVDHWSFGLDLKILLRTPTVVLSGRGAR